MFAKDGIWLGANGKAVRSSLTWSLHLVRSCLLNQVQETAPSVSVEEQLFNFVHDVSDSWIFW